MLPAMAASLEKGAAYFILTKRGRPIGAFIPMDMFEAIQETFDILQDEELTPRLIESIQQMQRGETRPLSEMKKRHGFD